MARDLNEALWRQLSEDTISAMREWRQQHPTATLREIENELDARLARARARMLEDLATGSTTATWHASPRLHAPTCPHCNLPLDERGTHPRTLLTHGGQTLTLERSYGVCPACGAGLFPPR